MLLIAQLTLYPTKCTAWACWVNALSDKSSIVKHPGSVQGAVVVGLPLQGQSRALVQQSPSISPTPRHLSCFQTPVQLARIKAAVCSGLVSFYQMCKGRGNKQAIQSAGESVHLQPVTRPTTFLWSQPGTRGHPQAPGTAPRASVAALARVEDAQGTPAALQDTDGSQGQQH